MNQSEPIPITPSLSVKDHLIDKKYSLISATLLSLLLGITTAIVYSLMGPMFEALSNPHSKVEKPIVDILGPALGSIIKYFFNIETVIISESIKTLPFFLAGLATIRAILSASQWYLWEVCCEQIAKNMRKNLVEIFLKTDPARMLSDDKIDSSLSSTMTTDIKLIKEYLVRYYGGLPREVIQIIIFTITLYLLSPKLFAVFFLGAVPAIILSRKLGKKVLKRTRGALDDYSELTSWLETRFSGLETIKHFKSEAIELKKMAEKSHQMSKKFLKSIKSKAQTSPALEFVGVCSLAFALFLVFRTSLEDQMSGTIQLSFFATLAILAQSAGKLGKYLNSAKEGKAAVSRLQEQTSYWQSNSKKSHFQFDNELDPSTLISISNLEVSYSSNQTPALIDFSMEIKKGKSYCVIGPSGSGKSTLLKTILGALSYQKGTLYFNNYLFDPGSILYVPQSIILAPCSIAKNIAYPSEAIDFPKVKKALDEVGLKSLLDIAFDEDSYSQLSGGQLQRILLARISYHQAKLLIIDEGTSALDPVTETKISKLIKRKMELGTTVLMVAHRESFIKTCEISILLDKGRLIDQDNWQKQRKKPELSQYFSSVKN